MIGILAFFAYQQIEQLQGYDTVRHKQLAKKRSTKLANRILLFRWIVPNARLYVRWDRGKIGLHVTYNVAKVIEDDQYGEAVGRPSYAAIRKKYRIS